MSDHNSYLYKYRSIDDENLDRSKYIFTKNELYFATVDQFNDPFDCKFDYSFEASKKDTKKYLQKSIDRNNPNWSRSEKRKWVAKHVKVLQTTNSAFMEGLKSLNEDMLRDIGIYSLSRVPNDILMWSHYANDHKGFCLKFWDDTTNRFIARALEITYSEKFPVVNPITEDDMSRFKKTLLTKSKHWEYEAEWRIIDHENGPGRKRFPPYLLVGVIFGCRMLSEHKKLVRAWCENRDTEISFYQAQETAQSYSLEIVEL